MVARDTANRFHRVASFVREVQSITAPVGGVSAAFNHVSLFEFVDQHDEAAGQNAEVFRERTADACLAAPAVCTISLCTIISASLKTFPPPVSLRYAATARFHVSHSAADNALRSRGSRPEASWTSVW